MQCIARAIEHFSATHFEIVNLAYAAMNLMIFIFWWNEPIITARKSTWEAIGNGLLTILTFTIGGQDGDVELSRKDRVPRFGADNKSDDVFNTDAIVLEVGVCFVAIHRIAWSFSFPIHTELLIWRMSSVAISAFIWALYLEVSLGGRSLWF